MKRCCWAILFLTCLVPRQAAAQFPLPVDQAVALLTAGTTTFTIVGVDAAGYVNFGSDREAAGYGFRDNAGTIEV